jgi:NTE family protein
MTRPRLGLALGSGSARGWSHIGVIDALHEAGIEPDVVCGTSMGALVGGAYVAGELDALRQWAETATWREIVALVDVRLTGGGVVGGHLVTGFLNRFGMTKAIEACAKPFAAVATDLVTGREIWFETGLLAEAVRASISLPGIFGPVRSGEKWLVDGGLCNPVPVSVCRALGAEIIIAVNLNGDLMGRRFQSEPDQPAAAAPPPVPVEFITRMLGQLPAGFREQAAQMASGLLSHGPASPGYFEVLANSINVMQDHITRTRLAGEPPHVMLLPRLRQIGLMEFNRAREAIAEGRTCVEQALPIIRRLIH